MQKVLNTLTNYSLALHWKTIHDAITYVNNVSHEKLLLEVIDAYLEAATAFSVFSK